MTLSKSTVVELPGNLTVIGHFMPGACELIHIFCVGEKSSVVMLKILGANIQNLVTQDLFALAINYIYVNVYFIVRKFPFYMP